MTGILSILCIFVLGGVAGTLYSLLGREAKNKPTPFQEIADLREEVGRLREIVIRSENSRQSAHMSSSNFYPQDEAQKMRIRQR